MIVADTNLVAYLLIQGDKSDSARQVYALDPEWRLPSLWRAEFLNVLATCVRADVLNNFQALECWFRALSLFGRTEEEPDGTDVLASAVTFRLSAYDAQFVVTAGDLGVPLVTSDRGILASCPDIAVSMSAFCARGPSIPG